MWYFRVIRKSYYSTTPHINGNPLDDRLENLQILCPNCHSQTDSYCKRQKIRKSTKSINSNIDEGLSTQKETSDVNVG